MKNSELTYQQIERFIRKIAQKFPLDDDASIVTDVHLYVSQETGEMVARDDDGTEITRCVVESWIDNKSEDFYQEVATPILRNVLREKHELVDNLGILKPFSFVLVNDDGDDVTELYVADDDTVIVDDDLMKGLDADLDDFFDQLVKE